MRKDRVYHGIIILTLVVSGWLLYGDFMRQCLDKLAMDQAVSLLGQLLR